jgi:hypothetical protein
MAMRAYVSRRSALLLLGTAAWGLAIALTEGNAVADSVSETRAMIGGAYILEEWHGEDRVFRPPQVEGRVVFCNGAVVTILINKMHEEPLITFIAFGGYELSAGPFSYRYDNASIFTQTESAINLIASSALGRDARFRHYSGRKVRQFGYGRELLSMRILYLAQKG